MGRARRVIVLGDGAPWIWNLAGEHFPGAIEIVDLYHAREHLHALGRLVMPTLGQDGPGWLAERLAELDRGDIAALLAAARQSDPRGLPDPGDRDGAGLLRDQPGADALRPVPSARPVRRVGGGRGGLQGGRGPAPEAVRHALDRARRLAAIVSLRCEAASGRWEEVWGRIHNQTSAA